MDWVIVGAIATLITAVVTAWGLRAQRRKPDRKWPIVAVGLFAGLVAGLAIVQAIWLGDRYPHRRKAIDRLTVLVASGLMMVVAYYAYSPILGLGPEIESGHIERTEQGYAITLSHDWRVEDISGLEEFGGEAIEPGVEPDLIALNEDSGDLLMIMTLDDGEAADPRMSAFGIAATFQTEDSAQDVSWETIESAIGEVFRVDATMVSDDGVPLAAPLEISVYLVTADQVALQMLIFYGQDAPADRWFDIVETFEYLDSGSGAADGTAMDATPTPRRSPTPRPEGIYEPTAWDFTVEFPADWQVDPLQPYEWTRLWTPLRWSKNSRPRPQLTGHQGGSNARCIASDISVFVADLEGPVSTGALTEHFLEAFAGDPDFERQASIVTWLPAGRAGRIRAVDSRGWFYETWLIGAGESWMALECRAPKTIPGGWREVAESIVAEEIEP